MSPPMWLLASAIIHCHRINRCRTPIKALSMSSYHLPEQQKVEIDYQSYCGTQSGQLIRVSRIGAFVVFYKDLDVSQLHTGGNYLQNRVSPVNM
jgi:hypothetical protein